jgi:hypothetical protein
MGIHFKSARDLLLDIEELIRITMDLRYDHEERNVTVWSPMYDDQFWYGLHLLKALSNSEWERHLIHRMGEDHFGTSFEAIYTDIYTVLTTIGHPIDL